MKKNTHLVIIEIDKENRYKLINENGEHYWFVGMISNAQLEKKEQRKKDKENNIKTIPIEEEIFEEGDLLEIETDLLSAPHITIPKFPKVLKNLNVISKKVKIPTLIEGNDFLKDSFKENFNKAINKIIEEKNISEIVDIKKEQKSKKSKTKNNFM